MTSTRLTLADADPSHFEAIIAIERATAGGSVVALTEGYALHEAHARGHHILVALEAGAVAGWAWFSVDLGRGAEQVGHIYRVAVAQSARRSGVGRALLEHARAELRARECTRIRATVPADDAGARAFFVAAGFGEDAITMEQPL